MQTVIQSSSYSGAITEINTVAEVRAWFQELNTNFGLSWHPDDPFDWSDEHSEVEISGRLNKLMNQSFEICESEGIDIYELGIETTKFHRTQIGLGIQEVEK